MTMLTLAVIMLGFVVVGLSNMVVELTERIDVLTTIVRKQQQK